MPIEARRTLSAASGNDSIGTATGWIPTNFYDADFNASFNVRLSAGEGTGVVWQVEHTFDDIQNPSVTPIAFDHSTVSAAQATQDGSYGAPVRAVRLTLVSSAVSVRVCAQFQFFQGGL